MIETFIAITSLQKRKRKFSLQSTKTEFDFKPVYSDPPPEFFEFKPVVNDVFRALVAARKPKSTTQSAVDPEITTNLADDNSNNVQAENDNINYVPTAEVQSAFLYIPFSRYNIQYL